MMSIIVPSNAQNTQLSSQTEDLFALELRRASVSSSGGCVVLDGNVLWLVSVFCSKRTSIEIGGSLQKPEASKRITTNCPFAQKGMNRRETDSYPKTSRKVDFQM